MTSPSQSPPPAPAHDPPGVQAAEAADAAAEAADAATGPRAPREAARAVNGTAGDVADRSNGGPAPAPASRSPLTATPPPPEPAPRPESAPARAHGPGHTGRHHPDPETVPRQRGRTGAKRRRLLLLVPVLLAAATAATLLGYRYWYEATYFVVTDNASVTGDLVQVGSLNAGRIVATRVDIGRPVRQGQEIAVVAMPQEIGSNAVGGAPKLGITGTTDTLVPVYSPLNGIVAARMGYVGGTVAAGQPIYALVDPTQVWVKANIEEASAWRVEVGQPAQIHVDALNRDFVGQVDAITPASAATFSLLPTGNASGNFTKVTQYVPVKILVETRGYVLPLGTSVSVRIAVRAPGSDLPLPWNP